MLFERGGHTCVLAGHVLHHEQLLSRVLQPTTTALLTASGFRSFDLVYARFLLTHLTEPAAACERQRGALRPGGTVVIEDIDYRGSISEPDGGAYRRYCEIFVATAVATELHRQAADRVMLMSFPRIVQVWGYTGLR